MLGLLFEQVWALDFEFVSKPGTRPAPVCMVARELGSNQLLRLWRDELTLRPPFRVDARTLFVGFFASAEWSCFLELGWPLPERVLDLFVEFRAETNGRHLPAGRGLLGALSYHGIPAITADEKHDMRELVLGGGPWSPSERAAILEYCQSDVDALGPLLERMLLTIRSTPRGLGQALLRGRYTTAVARIEHAGVPIDVSMLGALRANWEPIKLELIGAVDQPYGVYEGTTFKAGRFAEYLCRHDIPWPRTKTGQLALDSDTFTDQTKSFPQLRPLKDLRHALGEMRLEELAVGPDGRNRYLISPFGASSSRNTPSNTKSIFGPAVWLRGLIKPAASHAVAYLDWSCQEVAIAAALSGDTALTASLETGDPYMAFAIRAGLAPADATTHTHPVIREMCKVAVLGTNYGMGARTLANRTGLSELDARELLRRLARTYPTFWTWAEHQIDLAVLTGRLTTVFGWPIHVTDTTRSTSLRNFPMQANGAEMLRLACCLATEAGVTVCAPVHDALLIEAPELELEDAIATARAAMTEASHIVLDGPELQTATTVVHYPDRYADPRGAVMWRHVTELLSRADTTCGG
jgi:hypothetical protein